MTTEANAVAAIDCGTNSIRLLIAARVDHRLRDIHREMRIVRLGEGVDATQHALAGIRAESNVFCSHCANSLSNIE